MRKTVYHAFIFCSIFSIVFLSGCATVKEDMKVLVGVSTRVIEESRKDAIVKVFDYDHKTCWEKAEKALKAIPSVSVYDRDTKKNMIAFYYLEINTTPVGIFFKEIDATHTQIEVASQSPNAKNFISKKLFTLMQDEDRKSDIQHI